jgi:hypothetical protein
MVIKKNGEIKEERAIEIEMAGWKQESMRCVRERQRQRERDKEVRQTTRRERKEWTKKGKKEGGIKERYKYSIERQEWNERYQ